ncbi:uncharacterized protein LOC118094487 [Zootoca vivipara]|uniref:uncharacterized protein LOC118094487 n=1 Tax=Zootoca vivipara TaxID=8524 RepID=UPI0015917D21|nr:uncharacterized protein LOC118094487 [Zootoca vivipara]XP_060137420.1 uncharacterized protein LOC118094487 [Zootoca vivipara]
MDDNLQEEAGMKGNTLESSTFHQPHKLTSQQRVAEECVSTQPLSSAGKACSPLTCSFEEGKNPKRAKLAGRRHTSPSLAPPFPPMLELQGMSYRQVFQNLDLHSQCPFSMPQCRRTPENAEAAHAAPYVPISAPARPGVDLSQPPSLSHQLMGCCHQNAHECMPVRDNSRVTSLYAELIRELEQQVAELRRALASREEAAVRQEKRIQELELENRELKALIQNLEEQNDFLSIRNGAGGGTPARVVLGMGDSLFDVNENNIQFLKSLVAVLENVTPSQVSGLQSPPSLEDQRHTPATVPHISPGWRTLNTKPGGLSPWINADGPEIPVGLSDATSTWDNHVQETLSEESPVWALPMEENGRTKLELVPNSQVYVSHHQLEDLSQVSTDNPELMTRRLLDYFFSRETLARSSATGQRIAHNNRTMERPIPLPVAVVNAIKEYVTKTCGRGCNFNAVINSKCGTSRRAIKKMIDPDCQSGLNGVTTTIFQEPFKG